MNEIMKVLTVTSAIFIPLTFIVGVYGMNFDFMPELKWKYGYFIVWGIMATLGITLFFVFMKRGWLKRNDKI
jgi:magnesium transporter